MNTMTTMNPIEIRNLKGEILFTHRAEYNTILKTLNKAVTDGVKLQGANLICKHLVGSDLRYADLRDADLRYTDLTGADCRGTDLRGAIYTPEQIYWAITDETTIF